MTSSEGALQSSERNLAAVINTIPTAAWTTRPDGYCDFLNQIWLDYAGMTAEQAQGWGWADAVHPEDREMRELRERYASLTPRERDVMKLVVSGLLNKQVADELCIVESTVKAHRGQVMQKMKANSVADLVTMTARL